MPGGAVAAGLHAAARPPRLPHRHLLLAAGHILAAPGMDTWTPGTIIMTITITPGPVPAVAGLLLHADLPGAGGHGGLAHRAGRLLGPWLQGGQQHSNTPYNLIILI